MGGKLLKGLAGAVIAAALATGTQAVADPADLPAGTDLGQFYPDQSELPPGWSLDGQSPRALPSTASTTPPGCSLAGFFPAASSRAASGPDGSDLRVRLFPGSDGVGTIRSWAKKCESFTAPGSGGTTGKNWMSVQPAEAPVADALAYRVTGQGPFVAPELALVGSVRGVLVLVSQSGPTEDAAAEVYRATTAKITSWRG